MIEQATAVPPRRAIQTLASRLAAALGGERAETGAAISWTGPAGFPEDRPWSEATIQALSGLMQVHGRDAGRPRRLGLDVASVAAGVLAAQGVLAAEIGRLRGRPVPTVRTSVLQAALVIQSHYFVVATGLGDAVPGPGLPAPGPPFRSADGHWFEIETLDPDAWKAFWERLGAGGAPLGRAWTIFRWRYERAACSLPAELHEATARRRLADLEHLAAETGVSLMALRTHADLLADPRLASSRPRVTPVAPDGGGENATATAAAAPAAATGTGLPLEGVRVVEATSRIQGPMAGMLLRMLGASVVRVKPPEGDYGRAALCLHRQKDEVVLDLATPGDRDGLADLVAGADVFLHNWRPGKAAEWGLDVDDLVGRRPGLVHATSSGWGDGPGAPRALGTDFLVQAHTGLGQGLNPHDEPPFPSRVILGDLFGALVGTEAVLTGLHRRLRHGGAWAVRSSLLAGAMALQADVLEPRAGGDAGGRVDGRPRWGPLDRPLLTAEGWLVLGLDDDPAFRRLCRVVDVDPDAASRAATEARLVARLGEGGAAGWEPRLAAAGVPCAVAPDDLAAVPADPRMAALFEPVGTGGLAPRSPWSFA
ncbi:MAG TPA: CoA transferase [Acidimicrobiales bacterium]|nr:CoA transferase [Acidimicrobiales bacterium]